MTNKHSRLSIALVQLVVVAQVLFPLQAIAGISNLPPLVKANVPPNVFYTLDDSGSMMFEVLPDTLSPFGDGRDGTRTNNQRYCGTNGECWIQFVFPQPLNVYNVGGAGNYANNNSGVVGFNNNITVARWRSSTTNKAYYDPGVVYEPWVDPSTISLTNPYGNLMANASPTAARYNPVAPTGGTNTATINLTQNTTLTAFTNPIPTWLNDAGTGIVQEHRVFYPALYYVYSPGNAAGCTTSNLACFNRVEIRPATIFPAKDARRTDCIAAICTYTEEMQNFANWFQYYRSRILMARAGSSKAFANQSPSLRVGFGTINTDDTRVLNVSNDFSAANKQLFINTLYSTRIPRAGTPLRSAVDEVGQYFRNRTVTGPWQTRYNEGSVADQISCRQNFNILMTDGYWNGGGAGSGRDGNVDAQDGTTKTRPDSTTYKHIAAPPYSDSHSGTLADIAMYYWVNDLRDDWTDKAKKNVALPKDGSDPAFWQHLVQYTVGLGVSGSLDPATDLPALTAGTKSWPEGATNQVDDLWHAAVNSHGKFFSAGNPKAFSDALDDALGSIAARTGDAAAIATSKNTLDIGLKLYTSTYQTADWSGRLEQKPLDPDTGNIKANDWDTDDKIPAPAARTIVTSNHNGDGGQVFSHSNLRSANQTIMDVAAAAYAPGTVVDGPQLVNYLRGDKSLEGKPFRARKLLLGDLVNSDPQYVWEGKDGGYIFLPNHIKGKTSYRAYLRAKKARAPTVYVGANDGMLHAFDATDVKPQGGTERFAFIPQAVIPTMPELAKPTYTHRFYVDGTPMIADAAIGSDPSAPWRTVLVGGLGAGGKSIYALDVSDPASFGPNKVLWERTAGSLNSRDEIRYSENLGYTIGTPQIGVLKDGRWVAVFGNGFASKNLRASLFVVSLLDGSIIDMVDTGVGDTAKPNGLSTPKLVLGADSTIEAVYAGDIQGNLWKFNFVTSDVSSSLKTTVQLPFGLAKPLFLAVDTLRKQPITTQPQIYPHPENGNMVLFGTGKIFEDTDPTTTDKETLYGIWDKKVSTQVSQGDLVGQDLTQTGSFYKVSNKPVPWASKRGWFITLKIRGGERVVNDPIVFEDQVIFTTLIPSSGIDPCTVDGLSTTLQISPFNGAPLGYKTIDTTGDGKVNTSDQLVSGRQSNATFGTTIIRIGNRKVKIFQADSKTGSILGNAEGGIDAKLSAAIPTVRLWRQIIGKN